MAIWLVRAGSHGEYEQKFIHDKRVYVTWDGLDVDLDKVSGRPSLEAEMLTRYPDEKPKAILNWASQVWPFAHEIKQGDLVMLPLKSQPAIQIGEIMGDYHFEPVGPDPYFHWRPVKWIGEAIPRANFGQDLLFSFGYARAVAYPPDTGYQARFAALQAEARAARRGLWAQAAPTPAAGHELVQISGLRRDGAVNPNEPDEYVEITNQGAVAQDLTGWHLDSERGAASGQVFHFPAGFIMQPGQVCRVYTDEVHPEWCRLSFGYRRAGEQ